LKEEVDSNAPRNAWPMGKVTLTLPDKYGLVRQVKVKASNVNFYQSCHILCPNC